MFARISLVILVAATVSASVAAPAALAIPPAPPSTRPAVRYDAAIGNSAFDWQTWSAFWAFKSVVKPAVPNGDVKSGSSDIRNEIDAFIDTKLRQKGMQATTEADKLTLIRRVTYDLTGLPPTPEEIRPFLADASADAYGKVVDRLLASPHYGERWGRHWLDVARYTPGRVSFAGVKGTAGDSHYRDYVVRSFNADKPYNQFLTEQLAGDLLPPSNDRQTYLDQIVAPAFLSIGAWFDQETDPNRLRLEMIDEQINTTTRAFMGISVACARCHDHKFDPIPIQDYYTLAGIFRSTRIVGDFSDNWRDGRVRQLRPLAMPEQVAANDAVRQQIFAAKADRWALLSSRHAAAAVKWKASAAAYADAAAAVKAAAGEPFAIVKEAEDFDGHDNLRITQLTRDGKGVEVIETQTPTAQWVKYKFDAPATGQYRLEALISTEDRNPLEVTVNGTVVAKEALASPTGGFDLQYQRWDVVSAFELRDGVNFLRISAKQGNIPRIDRLRLVHIEPAIQAKIESVAAERGLSGELLERFVYWPADPWPTIASIESQLVPTDRAALATIDATIDRLTTSIVAYPLAVSVTEQIAPIDLPVYLKGQTYRLSEYLVPRGVPRFLDHALPRPTIAPGESGRLELAHWLTDPRHPLTSRVMVNRIWGWHFGKGLVDSPSDFGSRGSKPTHPELLDWLAATFVEKGWSVKQLSRLIVTSAAYRRASEPTSDVDPDNHLLSHFPRRRLEAEALYDAMLSTTNSLVRQPGGQPLEFARSSNRAMYTLTTGRSPAGLGTDVRKMMSLFDAEMEGQPIGSRPVSATASQSLFWLNSPIPKYFADRFAQRLLKMDKLSDAKRIDMAYQLAIGRPATPDIVEQSLAFVTSAEESGDSKEQAWSRLCQALYASVAFRYVD